MMLALVQVNFGWIGLRAEGTALVSSCLPQSNKTAALKTVGASRKRLKLLRRRSPNWELYLEPGEAEDRASSELLEQVARSLDRYFHGEGVDFDFPIRLSDLSVFTRKVLEITGRIPYGEARTYKWVAERVGKPGAVRAVGQALHRNPTPLIIPCHRVIGSDGSLVGFGAGLRWKRRLLKLEQSSI